MNDEAAPHGKVRQQALEVAFDLFKRMAGIMKNEIEAGWDFGLGDQVIRQIIEARLGEVHLAPDGVIGDRYIDGPEVSEFVFFETQENPSGRVPRAGAELQDGFWPLAAHGTIEHESEHLFDGA